MPRTKPYAKKHTFEFMGPKGPIELCTYTKSEARSLIKKKMGISPKGRLPIGSEIRRVQETS